VIVTIAELNRSQVGAALVLLTLAILVIWIRHGPPEVRWPVLISAASLSVLGTVIYWIAVSSNVWRGPFFVTVPLLTQLGIFVPFSLLGWIAWLSTYGWVMSRSCHPLLLYSGLALLAVPLAMIADRTELSGGLILVAEDGKVWIDALIAAAFVVSPVVLFEAVRRGIGRDILP
jgi:hypothetical protein